MIETEDAQTPQGGHASQPTPDSHCAKYMAIGLGQRVVIPPHPNQVAPSNRAGEHRRARPARPQLGARRNHEAKLMKHASPGHVTSVAPGRSYPFLLERLGAVLRLLITPAKWTGSPTKAATSGGFTVEREPHCRSYGENLRRGGGEGAGSGNTGRSAPVGTLVSSNNVLRGR